MKLNEKKCEPCSKGTAPLKEEVVAKLRNELSPGWEIIEGHHLRKEYSFHNFQKALDFTNQVGQVAENEGHHPDIYLSWGKVVVQSYTHKIDGLSENDFILAAKLDALETLPL